MLLPGSRRHPRCLFHEFTRKGHARPDEAIETEIDSDSPDISYKPSSGR
jgi:hypothetical protein